MESKRSGKPGRLFRFMYPPARKKVTKIDHWMGVGMVAFPRQLWNLVGALLVSRFRRAEEPAGNPGKPGTI